MASILIVDDSRTSRAVVMEMLGPFYEVLEASNGLEGYDMYFTFRPDLVLMDITMPILDGITCLQKIREQDPLARIVIMTSNAQKAKISKALSYGCMGYLVKPVMKNELLQTISSALND